ncbi:MAG: glutamate--tRNA ligase [Armatimonadetes bacterium]|nr:glutamate--tRNA ligase [Armatimonadota bacterium]
MSVRVRYAPSPTGSPHVGNIRTALFDYLLARRFGGTMIVRLEDTDRSRYIPGCEEEILESLRWIGVEWQEGPDIGGPYAPYRQSERAQLGIYREWVDNLIESGNAYWAFDTPEELEEMRLTQQLNKLQVGYFGGHWREASAGQIAQATEEGKPGVIRLKMPRGRKLVVHDAIRGRVEFDSDVVDDPVLLKADGMPTYHCAAMIDDHLMEITHIIRGEEWISSAPKHVWLFEALGWEPPEFVHVPVILGKDGKKLSKRHGDTKCLDYRDGGYLPEALANFIALIGWAPGGDRELMSMQEMAEAFDLSGLQPSPGVFDLDKLVWMNGNYIRSLAPEQLADRVRTYLHRPETADYWLRPEHEGHKGQSLQLLENSLDKDAGYVTQAIALERERVTTLADFGEACAFFLQDEPPMDEKAVEKWFGESHVRGLCEDLVGWLSSPSSSSRSENASESRRVGKEGVRGWRSGPSAADCEAFLRAWAETHGFEKLGPIVHPVRVALTGKTTGPGLFELMEVLGPERMVRRLQRAKEMLR